MNMGNLLFPPVAEPGRPQIMTKEKPGYYQSSLSATPSRSTWGWKEGRNQDRKHMGRQGGYEWRYKTHGEGERVGMEVQDE